MDRLGLAARQSNGRLALRPGDVDALRAALGRTPPIDGLSVTEVKTLAALARSPLGVRSLRELARRADLSPTAAGRAFRSLSGEGLARSERGVRVAGGAQRSTLLHANRSAPRWGELAPLLTRVEFPVAAKRRDRRVPARLRHLFWNTAPSQLVVDDAGPYIARRLLSTMSLDGLAWGAGVLRAEDWRQAGNARGLSEDQRALAANLAAAAEG